MAEHSHIISYSNNDGIGPSKGASPALGWIDNTRWLTDGAKNNTIKPSGESKPHNNLPQYKVAAVWKRIS